MRDLILDTNILIYHWKRSRRSPLADCSAAEAEQWGRKLIAIEQANAIVTPVYLEFVCGTMSAHELRLARAFLGVFRILDEGHILEADWVEARRLAERVPRDPEPRDLGDCLIRVLAKRFHHDVRTADLGMPY